MRILYGIQTTGNGHLSRSALILKQLKLQGHKIDVIFSGSQINGKIWSLPEFAPYYRYKGLSFATKNGKIDYFGSLQHLQFREFYYDIKNHPSKKYDLVLSDFEPISCRIAKQRDIPSIGISHQSAFQYDIPKVFNPFSALITTHFAPTDYHIGVHWHHFGQPILPPIIEKNLLTNVIKTEKNKILVYMPYENQTKLTSILRRFSDYRFHIYSNRKKDEQDKNLFLKPFSRENFIYDLNTCSGVMGQGGFELASEAIFLGKKLLMKPIDGQYEQLSNAVALKQIAKGHVMHHLDPHSINHWLLSKPGSPTHYPDVANEIANWITDYGQNLNNEHLLKLCHSMWKLNSNEQYEVKNA